MRKIAPDNMDNIVGKGENAGYKMTRFQTVPN